MDLILSYGELKLPAANGKLRAACFGQKKKKYFVKLFRGNNYALLNWLHVSRYNN